jgi:sortase A
MEHTTTYVATTVDLDLRDAPPSTRFVEPTPVREPERELPPAQRATLAVSSADLLAVLGRGLTIFGVLVVAYVAYLALASQFVHDRDQRTRTATLSSLLVGRNASIGGVIDEGTPVASLDIPRLGLHETVVEGTTAKLLEGGPGHLRSSPLPGQAGNVVVAGRRSTFGAPFADVGELRPGDEIRVVTGQNKASYVVRKVGEVDRRQADPVSATTDNRMTLVTSAPKWFASRRLAVVADLRSPVVSTPAARPNLLRPDELGLEGDTTNTLALLVWAQLLLVASCASAWLYRRWSRWPTYLVVTPVIALLVLLVFDSFTPLLPSTL